MVKILKRRWYIVAIIFLLAGFIFFQQISTQPKGKKETTYKVKRQTLKETLSLSGSIDAGEHVTLRFQTSGRLTWVGVKEGDYVKEYQALASLDQREVQKNLEKALRDYSKERADFEEDKQVTYKSGALTDTIKRILEKNQFDLDKAVADVEIKQLAVEFSTLVTPIEGIVTKIASPYAGVNVTPSQAEFEIINPKTIYFSSTAEQGDVVKLKNGMKGEVVLDAYPEEKFTGEIYYISFIPKAGESGAVYEVKLKLKDNAVKDKLRLEMTGDVSFILKEKRDVLVIPQDYLKTQKGQPYVYKKINGKKIKTKITVGERIDEKVEVKEGLKEADVIVN